SLAHTPLFQVMLVLQNAPVESLEIRDLSLRPVEGAGTVAKFDLTLGLEERNGELAGAVEYATGLFDATTIDHLILRFERLLTEALAAPEESVGELSLLGEGERRQILEEWNDTEVPRPAGLSFHGLFAAQVARTPKAPAVFSEEEILTY